MTTNLDLLHVRYWLENAVKSNGAGVGHVAMEETEGVVDIVLEGRQYRVSIKKLYEDNYDDCA